MKVSKVAQKLGVSADTIRYYTRIGILQPSRTDNGYNAYSEQDIQRLRFAMRAKMLGFSLADIKSIIDISESGEVPCPKAREVITRNLGHLGQSIEESLNLFRRMEKAVAVWDGMPDQNPDGHAICQLIEDWDQEINHE